MPKNKLFENKKNHVNRNKEIAEREKEDKLFQSMNNYINLMKDNSNMRRDYGKETNKTSQ